MAKIFDKALNFLGWETEEEEIMEEQELVKEEPIEPQFVHSSSKKDKNKVVNIHSMTQMKVVIVQPENFDDAQGICEHLKNKKPVVINLEELEKDCAQRIVDFLSGAVYALDGNIQKVANGIFLIAPYNVDIMADFKDELKNKNVFPWMK